MPLPQTNTWFTGGQYFKARSQDLSNTLMEAITARGGKVFLETAANRIWLKKGSVAGVEDHRGTRHSAKAVFANSSVPDLFGQLIPSEEVPNHYLKMLNSRQPSLSSFIVWLGLNKEIKCIDNKHFNRKLMKDLRDQLIHTGVIVDAPSSKLRDTLFDLHRLSALVFLRLVDYSGERLNYSWPPEKISMPTKESKS